MTGQCHRHPGPGPLTPHPDVFMLKYHGQRDGVSSWASLVTPPTRGVKAVSPSIRMDGWGGGGAECQMPQPAEVGRALVAVGVALRRTQEGECSRICRRSAPPPRQPMSADLSGAGCVQGTVSRAFHLLALETPCQPGEADPVITPHTFLNLQYHGP